MTKQTHNKWAAWEVTRGLTLPKLPEHVREHARTMVKSGHREAKLMCYNERMTQWSLGGPDVEILGD